MSTEAAASAAAPLFTKRRKAHLRARTRTPSPPPSAPPSPSVHLPIRRPARRLGLVHSSSTPSTLPSDSPQPPPTAASSAPPEVLSVVNRFTHQTGAILDVDKHMMTYIESRMSQRQPSAHAAPSAPRAPSPAAAAAAAARPALTPASTEARGASLGKLHEVDLGEEARKKNIERTQAALSGVAGGAQQQGTRGGKRDKRRRTSTDIERDRLVEEVLRETRLDIYTTEEQGAEGEEEEGEADEKIAERFKREFIDAISSKRRRKVEVKGGKKEAEKKVRGPKLGGSRMARAQMREKEMGAKK